MQRDIKILHFPSLHGSGGNDNPALANYIEKQTEVNDQLKQARRAALNIMEDAIKSKEELRKSEQKYRTLFESMDEGYILCEVIFDKDEKPVDILYLEANDAAVRMTGSELVGKTTRQLSNDFEQHWYDCWGRVAKTGIAERHEFYAKPLSVWYRFYVFRVGGAGDKRVAAVYEDITGRKQHEQRQEFFLKLSDLLRSMYKPDEIQEKITRIIMEHFKSDRCYYCEVQNGKAIVRRDAANKGLTSVTGVYLLDDLPVFKAVVEAKKPFIVNDINTTDLVDESLRELCIRLQTISFVDVPVVKKDRVIGILCIAQGAPRKWTEFEIQLAQEVTERAWSAIERANTEEALLLSEELNRIALLSADMGTWNWDVGPDILEWNDQYLKLLGVKDQAGEKGIKHFLQFVHPDDREKVQKELKRAVEDGVYHSEFRIVRSDDQKLRWMTAYARAVPKKVKGAVRMVGVMYDITQRKKMELQKDDFIGIASHELRTPLTSIKVYVELLCEIFKEKDDVTGVRYMQKLDGQVDRITELVSTLLDSVRISEGQLKLNLIRFDMNELISRQIDDLKHLSRLHKLIFEPGKIPLVKADKERIEQVISNFLSNAIKYSPKGGDILITSKDDEEGGLRVCVKDKGMGIPTDLKDKIFDRFFRINYPDVQTFPGMGIGLYIARNIIKRHKGHIGVESTMGCGSEFYFVIPYNTDTNEASFSG